MDDPATLRRKAARYFDMAAASPNAKEAGKLNEVGCQLKLWADDLDLEKGETGGSRKALKRRKESGG